MPVLYLKETYAVNRALNTFLKNRALNLRVLENIMQVYSAIDINTQILWFWLILADAPLFLIVSCMRGSQAILCCLHISMHICSNNNRSGIHVSEGAHTVPRSQIYL